MFGVFKEINICCLCWFDMNNVINDDVVKFIDGNYISCFYYMVGNKNVCVIVCNNICDYWIFYEDGSGFVFKFYGDCLILI